MGPCRKALGGCFTLFCFTWAVGFVPVFQRKTGYFTAKVSMIYTGQTVVSLERRHDCTADENVWATLKQPGIYSFVGAIRWVSLFFQLVKPKF